MLSTAEYIPNIRPEPFEYLDPLQSWGTFAVLQRQRKYQYAKQRCYPLSELPSVIESCKESDRDYWISQAAFNKFNRRKVNLHSIGVNFVDLDYYNVPAIAQLEPEEVLHEYLLPRLQRLGIPFPSLVIDSGWGLQIKWFTERLPARALPRWDRLQTELVKLLEPIGADKQARDASRILRVVGTVNQKSGLPVRVIWSDTGKDALPIKYEFNVLCDRVLPYTQQRLEELRAKRAERTPGTKFSVKRSTSGDVIKMLKSASAHTLENLNWHRLHDLKKIVEMRGGMADGQRELMAFYLCNFYALRYAQSGLDDLLVWHEFYQLCRIAAPHWTDSYARAKVQNVFDLMKRTTGGETQEWNGKEVPLLYVPKNDTIIDLFGITNAEQAELSTIIDADEKRRRKAEANRQSRRCNGVVERSEYVDSAKSEANDRMQKVLMLTSQGFKQLQIAEMMGISINAVKSLKKRAVAERK